MPGYATITYMRAPHDPIKDLVGLPEAAQILGLHRATVNDMVIAGRLRGYRLGAHWYVRRLDLETFRRSYQRPKTVPHRKVAEIRRYWTEQLLRWLLHWHDAASAELDVVLDLHVGNIRKYLALAEQEGLVTRDDCGRWTLTIDGLARAEGLPRMEESTAPIS
jgi:excisionase family DNA binding protein